MSHDEEKTNKGQQVYEVTLIPLHIKTTTWRKLRRAPNPRQLLTRHRLPTPHRLHSASITSSGVAIESFLQNLQVDDDLNHRNLTELAKKFGQILLLRMGQRNLVVVSTPDLSKEVLHKRHQPWRSSSIPPPNSAP
ncbi:hypothetical protein RHMOL_Rhmol03G0152000 [Rhododendron molle]|uniref:Uncharacterized protein n=1 Tax=Rhododendron molle TaxID=49168 RepID=A0ACC0PED2_RHOML|nr:hypothetical protein RHMOL_Rhmol03G0152000 [Rhododendron molle]